MTPPEKAKQLFDRMQYITLNKYIALECSMLFCNEMIKTFEAIVGRYSKDFQKSVDYWVEVRKQLPLIS